MPPLLDSLPYLSPRLVDCFDPLRLVGVPFSSDRVGGPRTAFRVFWLVAVEIVSGFQVLCPSLAAKGRDASWLTFLLDEFCEVAVFVLLLMKLFDAFFEVAAVEVDGVET